MVQLNFDANQVAPNTGMQAVPEGWYNIAISESEVKPTKDKAGAFLQLKCPIIDGEHAGKPIFIRLNIQNQNQTAVDIAYGELSAICHVIGVFQVADTSQMHGIPFQVKVVVRPAKDGYDESNDVKAYRDAAGNEPGKGGGNGGGAPAQFGGNSAPAQAQGNAAFGGQAGQGQQADPNAGNQNQNQNQNQNGNGNGGGFGGGQATQQADQPAQNGNGNAGWTQNQNGNGNGNDNGNGGGNGGGNAPWGQQQ